MPQWYPLLELEARCEMCGPTCVEFPNFADPTEEWGTYCHCCGCGLLCDVATCDLESYGAWMSDDDSSNSFESAESEIMEVDDAESHGSSVTLELPDSWDEDDTPGDGDRPCPDPSQHGPVQESESVGSAPNASESSQAPAPHSPAS